MMDNDGFFEFVKQNSVHFKECIIPIEICGKKYEFNIASITDKHIKLQLQLRWDDIFYSKNDSLERIIRNIIDEDGMYNLSNPRALSQRAITRRNLKGFSFYASAVNLRTCFKISNISQNAIAIEKDVSFKDISDSENALSVIVKNELISFKPSVDKKIKLEEEEKLKREELRRKKSVVFSKEKLIEVALDKKFYLKRNVFPVEVYGWQYLFNIEGIGEQAVKLSLSFSIGEIFNSDGGTVEGEIKNAVNRVFKEPCRTLDDFRNQLLVHENELDYTRVKILIGNDYFEFTLIVYPYSVKLLQFVRYENIMRKFNADKYCMETILKKHIEIFKPEPFSWDEPFFPKRKKEYAHPTVSYNKEDPDVIREKIMEKKRLKNQHIKNKSFQSMSRSSDISKILR